MIDGMSEALANKWDIKPAGGPPLGNTNSVKHGGSSKRHSMVLTNLGKRFPSVYFAVLRLRRELEALVVEARGGVSLGDAALINEACCHEMTRRVAENRVGTGKAPDDLADLKTSERAAEARNAILERLGIIDPRAPAEPDPAWIYRDRLGQQTMGGAVANGGGGPA
jgi:hypothetical protein